jgi:hypothetical protein
MDTTTKETRTMSNELLPTQSRVKASEIAPGDFLDQIDPNRELRGPRGGRYRYDGQLVQSRVDRVCVVASDGVQEVEMEIDPNGWLPARLRGFRIYLVSGRRVTLPGNLATLTTAVVRRAS